MKLQKTFTTIQEAYKWISEEAGDINNLQEGVSVDIKNEGPDDFLVTIVI